MSRILLVTALAVATALLSPTAAHADHTQYGLTKTLPACGALAKTAQFNYTACLGSYHGNDKNQDLSAALASFMSGTTLTAVGASDDAGTFGPFTSSLPGIAGTLTFDGVVTGPFALVLKAGEQFSIYYFRNDGSGISSLAYNTIGTNVNRKGKANALSHATLYGGRMNVVPEPSTFVLMATGLLGVGAVTRRRMR